LERNVLLRRVAVVIATCLLLSACGFQLRGTQNIPPQMQRLAINSSAPYGVLTIQLEQMLSQAGVRILEPTDEAPVTLKIFNAAIRNNTLSESASSTTKMYTMHYSVNFEILGSDGKVIYGPNTINTSRNYMVNENQVLSMGIETEKLQKEMQRDAAFQILTQLGSPAVAKAVRGQYSKKHPPKPYSNG
tara:strand:- start:59981 stop:60547 length:567 start_codon:yes stop_codon:yes gene_type:complete